MAKKQTTRKTTTLPTTMSKSGDKVAGLQDFAPEFKHSREQVPLASLRPSTPRRGKEG